MSRWMSRRRVATVAVGLLSVTGVAGALSAQAASPTGGSVSDTSRTASWTAGPFAAPNVTGTSGT